MSEKISEFAFGERSTIKPIILTVGLKSQVIEGKSFKQTPADRNLAILRYLRKWDGDWKNKNEIGTHHGVTINPKRLVPVLDELVERGLVEKRPSENPQARPWEYKITLLGKEKLEICESIVRDPTLKFVFGLKRKDTDELL